MATTLGNTALELIYERPTKTKGNCNFKSLISFAKE